MEQYELLFIIPAKYTEEELKQLSDKVAGIVTSAGGTIKETHDLGRRKLAYPIKNARNGNYVLFFYEAEPAVTIKLNELLRMSTDILRHLIIVRDPHITKIPSLIEEEPRHERYEGRPQGQVASQPATIQQQQPAKDKMSIAELDKKLEQILTDDIL
ncbi:MAG: 30S ribosomal protein S6 [Patescibacteria group bacterium]|jgi:small subunit ribosomal protein S6